MKFRTKGFTSLLLSCSFTVAAVSGLVRYVTPRGRTANWTGWTLWGLDKHEWGAVHMNACLLLLLIAAVHLFMNWRAFWSYVKKRKTLGLNLKLEMVAALLVTAIMVGGTVLEVPPMTVAATLNDKIKNHWEKETPTGPAPHAEEFTIDRFANSVGLSAEEVSTALQKEGIAVEDATSTIGELAESHGLIPNELYAAVKKHYPDAKPTGAGGGGRGRGFGGGRGPHAKAGGAGEHANGEECQHGEETCQHGEETTDEGHPGQGFGQGRGWGQGGRGMGMGWGRGRGQGRWGQGDGDAHEAPAVPESEPPAVPAEK